MERKRHDDIERSPFLPSSSSATPAVRLPQRLLPDLSRSQFSNTTSPDKCLGINTSAPPLRSKFLRSCYSDKVFAHVPLLRRLRFAAVVEQSISPRRGDMFIATSLPPLAPFGGAE